MKSLKGFMLCVVILSALIGLGAQTQPEWQWVRGTGGIGGDEGWSIAMDSSGNSYVTGYFSGTASFGTVTLTSSGGYDIFVSKLDTNGNYLWSKKAGGSGNDLGYGIAVDSEGNSYVTGYFSGTASFDTVTLISSGGYDIFVSKLDTNGNYLWSKKAGGSGNDYGWGIAVDNNGYIYVTGSFIETASFGSTTLTSIGNSDIFVCKLDDNGNNLWAIQAGGAGADRGHGITVDSVGICCVTGCFRETATFGSTSLISSGAYEVFISKIDFNGSFLWAVKAGGASQDYGFGIALDSTGNIYVTGCFIGIVNFGIFLLESSGGYDIFVCKLDSDGNYVWVIRAGGTGFDFGNCIFVENNGSSYITGSFEGISDFGASSLISSGDYDIFVCKLDPDSNYLFVKKAGGTSKDEGWGISSNGLGSCYITGYFEDSAFFDMSSLTSYGSSDIFIARLSPTITAQFTSDITCGPEPITVQFWDQSEPGPGMITSWFWTFGDGETSTLQHPSHTYLTPGFYTVSLSVTDQGGNVSTLVRPDYITVLERIYEIGLTSDATLNFGGVYLEEQSAYQAVTFSNTGNVDITISEVHFISAPLHFEFIDPFRDLVLAPGETDSILVRFAPQAVGALSDTLYIANNSTNQPLLSIRLEGTGLYVPPNPPGNVSITMNGYDAIITWDAVTQTIYGTPITPDYYLIFYNGLPDPEAPYYYLGWSQNLSYTHERVGIHAEYMFYHVIAYKYYGRGEPDLSHLKPGMPEAEVVRLLESLNQNLTH